MATRRTPAPAVPLPYAPPDAPTLPLRPSPRPGFCLQSQLFFASEAWANTLRPDVEGLLAGFERDWTAADRTAEAGSPFEVFRARWEREGWSNLTVMGLGEGPVHRQWGQAVVRGFVEHLQPSAPPLRQVAALFALYGFWSTQAPTMEQVYIAVDPPTLEYILTLPDLLAPSLDDPPPSAAPSPVDSPSALPSLDLSQILISLISTSAFQIIPTPLHLFPPIPSNSVRELRPRGMEQTAISLLGAEEEMEALVDGRCEELEGVLEGLESGERVVRARSRSRSRSVSGSPGVGGRAGGETEGWDDEKGWLASLREVQEEYKQAKRDALPGVGRGQARESNPASGLEARMLLAAEERTLQAVLAAGSGFGVGPEVLLDKEGRKRKLMELATGEGSLAAYEEGVRELGDTMVTE